MVPVHEQINHIRNYVCYFQLFEIFVVCLTNATSPAIL